MIKVYVESRLIFFDTDCVIKYDCVMKKISFEYSIEAIKALEPFKYFVPVLSLLLTSNFCFASHRSFTHQKSDQ